MTSRQIRKIAIEAGADLCGIAAAQSFSQAPEGFKPQDIFSNCKSVIVFVKALPKYSMLGENCIPYTHINNLITQEVDRISLVVSYELAKADIKNVVIPSDDPYFYWETERQYGRAILSLRHAGFLAGLGVIGKNTLLINDKYGNMIQLGAVLADVRVESDSIVKYEGCNASCRLCLDSCPREALDGKTVDQKLCRSLSNFVTEKGYIVKKCFTCRKVCPNAFGSVIQHK